LEQLYSQIFHKRQNASAAKFKFETEDATATGKTKKNKKKKTKKTEEEKKNNMYDYYKKEYYKYDHQLKIVQKALDKAKNND
jgi:hypothetical protein